MRTDMIDGNGTQASNDTQASIDEIRRAKRKSATEMVVADKKAEREARERQAAEKAREKARLKEKAAAEKLAAEIAAAEKAAADKAAAEKEAAEKAAAEAAAAEAARVAAEEAEAARIAAEEEEAARIAAEREAEELAERARLADLPGWVVRLAQVASPLLKPRPSSRINLDDMGTDSGAILFPEDDSSPVRVRLAAWASDPPSNLLRVVATRTLVLRRDATLDSEILGKLPAGCEAFVLQTIEVGLARVRRSLLTGAAKTAAPLGWVTSAKDNVALLAPTGPRSWKPKPLVFYTSLDTRYATARWASKERGDDAYSA